MPQLESDRNFQTIEEAWYAFRRNCMSDFTPPKINKMAQGAFYAGAQSALIMLAEALELTPDTAPPSVGKLFAEMQAWFITARAEANSFMQEKEEKANAKKKRS